MNAVEFLKDYSLKVEPLISALFGEEIKRAKKISPYSSAPYEKYLDFMKGGKKVRGALATLGYFCAGGVDEEAIVEASMAVEILHSFLLIHDDFIDRDLLRRGSKTVHIQYRDEFLKFLKDDEALHFGESFAVFTGNVGVFLAWRVIAGSKFSPELKIEAMRSLCDFLILTADGELLDVREGFSGDVSAETAYQARVLKTAYYTVAMPLVFGGRLAGVSEGEVSAMKEYGEKVGLAFQIRDDILGVFGKEEEIGKDTHFDIFDGKKTVMYMEALKRVSGKDRDFLVRYYGKGRIPDERIEKIKRIFAESGALDFANGEAKRLVSEGKKHVTEITDERKYRDLLLSLADFMVEREK